MDVMNPLAADDTVAARLAAATVSHRDAQETARVQSQRWRELVVEAVDAGLRIKDVARVASVSPARVHAILASSGG